MNGYLQPENCLLIERFEGETSDRALLDLIPFLVELATCPDVRNVGKRYVEYLKQNNTDIKIIEKAERNSSLSRKVQNFKASLVERI